jgi:hypothetical protein
MGLQFFPDPADVVGFIIRKFVTMHSHTNIKLMEYITLFFGSFRNKYRIVSDRNTHKLLILHFLFLFSLRSYYVQVFLSAFCVLVL